MCGIQEVLYSTAGYEIVTSDGRKGYLLELVGNGNTWLTIMFSKSQLMQACLPGTPLHYLGGESE